MSRLRLSLSGSRLGKTWFSGSDEDDALEGFVAS